MPEQKEGADTAQEAIQQRMQELEAEAEAKTEAEEEGEVEPEQMIPASQVLPLILPKRAGSLLFIASNTGEIALHLDRVMYITGSETGSIIRYDMEFDGRSFTEFATQHPISAIREAMQK